MSKRLIIVLALAFIFGLVAYAYAEVQNVKISGDLLVEGLGRNNIILRKGNQAPKWDANTAPFADFDHRIHGILSHVRVRLDADLTDNVSATVRLLNERNWNEESSSDTDIDLDLAYVAMKEFLYSPLSLTIGRQELMFGNGLIMGDPDGSICAGHGSATLTTGVNTTRATRGTILPKSLDDLSVRRAFDAIRATLNYEPLVIDGVFALMDENYVDVNDDVYLYGLNANYALDKNTTIEGYYWEKVRKKAAASGGDSTPTTNATGLRARDDWTGTLGMRAQYTGIKNLSVGLEGAWQFGRHVRNQVLYPDEYSDDQGARTRDAYALQMISKYNLSDLSSLIKQYEPVIGVSYTLLSGDPYKCRDKRYRGWDPMYENQGTGTLFNKILGFSNCQLVNVSTSAKLIDDVKLAIDYYHLRLIKPYRNAGGDGAAYAITLSGLLGDPTYMMELDKKGLGNEIDATLTYDYTEDVQFALKAGVFLPGDAFHGDNDETARQCIGSMKVTF